MTIVFKALASSDANVRAFQIFHIFLPLFPCVTYSSLSPYNDISEYIYLLHYIMDNYCGQVRIV